MKTKEKLCQKRLFRNLQVPVLVVVQCTRVMSDVQKIQVLVRYLYSTY